MNKLNQKGVENFITKIISDFRPEIKKRFIFRFADSYGKVLADTCISSTPRVITFFTRTISKQSDCSKELLQELVNHEVLHTWFESEDVVTKMQCVVNFRIHANKQLDLLRWRLNKNR